MPTRSAAESVEKHHEDTPSLHSAFHKDVTSLVCTIEDTGNQFMEGSEDLVLLDNKEILGSNAVVKLRTVEEVVAKKATRSSRGQGTRRGVRATSQVPQN